MAALPWLLAALVALESQDSSKTAPAQSKPKAKKLKVLAACEYSGIVRDAFLALGHDAMSADLLPTEAPGPHYQGDVFDVIYEDWDLMVAFPPCTYLTTARNPAYARNPKPDDEYNRSQAFNFFMDLVNAPIEKICIENPQGYANTHYRKPDQIVHPFYFGEPYSKRTCLWLKNLPLLISTNVIAEPPNVNPINGMRYWDNQTKDRILKGGGGSGHQRSRFWPGIAAAMALQWGGDAR